MIADDETYFDEPMFQDGIIAQAVDNVVTNDGVSYFSAAGNDDTQAYLNTSPSFVSGKVANIGSGNYLNFTPGAGTNLEQGFSLTSGQAAILTLDWDSPFYTASGVSNSLSIYIVNTKTNKVVADSTTDATATQAPYQIVGYQNTTKSTANYAVVIQLAKGAPRGRSSMSTTGRTTTATSRSSTQPIARRSIPTPPRPTPWPSGRHRTSTRRPRKALLRRVRP